MEPCGLEVAKITGEDKVVSAGLGHLDWIMCAFAATLLPAFCLEHGDSHIQRFSATNINRLQGCVFDFVTKPGAPGGIDDNRWWMRATNGCICAAGAGRRVIQRQS